MTMTICGKAGFRPRVQALSGQMSTVITMVAAGFGVAFADVDVQVFSAR
ncbi:hypothetical protein [Paraburkholderia sp. RL17-347-BIC-D]